MFDITLLFANRTHACARLRILILSHKYRTSINCFRPICQRMQIAHSGPRQYRNLYGMKTKATNTLAITPTHRFSGINGMAKNAIFREFIVIRYISREKIPFRLYLVTCNRILCIASKLYRRPAISVQILCNPSEAKTILVVSNN